MGANVVCIVATLESDHRPVGRHLRGKPTSANHLLSRSRKFPLFYWHEITLDYDNTHSDHQWPFMSFLGR